MTAATNHRSPNRIIPSRITKRKLNRPFEAIVDVRKQLAKFPNDFEGVTLLAGIQAEDTEGFARRGNHVEPFLRFAGCAAQAGRRRAHATGRLASQAGAGRGLGARRAGKNHRAVSRTRELALQAAQRIAHLGGTEKILLAAHDRQPMAVPEGVKNIGLLDSIRDLIPEETDPAKLAADYVKHLEQHPLDTEAREKLAIIYARPLQAAGSGDAANWSN